MNSAVINFLSDLSQNNDRTWFQENKSRYDEAKKEFEVFVDSAIAGISKFDDSVKLLNAKECIFRLFRDVRFSLDKSPYKTNFGAWIAKNGRKHPGPGYYIHIQAGGSQIAGGIYMPDPEMLKKIRQEINYNINEFESLLKGRNIVKLFNGLSEFDKKKMPPKGYLKETPGIEFLKNRHYILSQSISDEELVKDDFYQRVIAGFQAMQPFQDFLKKAVSE